jgi:hypothetical protein
VPKRFGKLTVIIVAFVVMGWSVPMVSGAALPVIDTAAISQMIQQTEQFARQIALMAQQIVLLKEQVQSMKGSYGMGTLGGTVNGWGTGAWKDIIDMVHSGVNPGDGAQVQAFRAAQSRYREAYPESRVQTTNPRLKRSQADAYRVNIAGLSAGESTLNTLARNLAELETLKKKIDKTPNLKAAMDLNAAIGVKQAQFTAELLRMQAVHLYVDSNGRTVDTNARAAQAEFFAN